MRTPGKAASRILSGLALVLGCLVLACAPLPKPTWTAGPTASPTAASSLPSATPSGSLTPTPPPLRADIRERVVQAWTRPEMVLHLRITAPSGELLREAWLDLPGERGRMEEHVNHPTRPGVLIVESGAATSAAAPGGGQATYSELPISELEGRLAATPAALHNPALLLAPPLADAFRTEWIFQRVETFEGRRATVWEVEAAPDRRSNKLVWVDAETFLPLKHYAGEFAVVHFETEFLPMDSLPAAHFSVDGLRDLR